MGVVRGAWLAVAFVGVAVAIVGFAGVGAAQEGPLQPRQAQLFQQACAQCHLRPGLGAPVVGDAAAWETRKALGLEALVANTVRGVGDMPPLGTCGGCDENDLRRLVAFLAGLPLPESE